MTKDAAQHSMRTFYEVVKSDAIVNGGLVVPATRKKPTMAMPLPQVTGQVTQDIVLRLGILHGEMTRSEIQTALDLKGRANFENRYLKPALADGLIELTLPDKPTSSKPKQPVWCISLRLPCVFTKGISYYDASNPNPSCQAFSFRGISP
jgi:hypothetical protein